MSPFIAENYEKRDLSNRGFMPWSLVCEAKDHTQRSTYSSKRWINQSRNILALSQERGDSKSRLGWGHSTSRVLN
ncbi:serS [Gossypium arboreum]|uniref:SerS n=1 Tax=Gossypium arboreum TaxID=29729 RepID=A0A0B0MEJ3_GOSAR|nr:serS [Gossypium arboreum]